MFIMVLNYWLQLLVVAFTSTCTYVDDACVLYICIICVVLFANHSFFDIIKMLVVVTGCSFQGICQWMCINTILMKYSLIIIEIMLLDVRSCTLSLLLYWKKDYFLLGKLYKALVNLALCTRIASLRP